jgi:flagellar biosynthesis/type III secretory pathway M-ring protein FliF/YscJ
MKLEPDQPNCFSVILFLVAILLAIALIVSCLILMPKEKMHPIVENQEVIPSGNKILQNLKKTTL